MERIKKAWRVWVPEMVGQYPYMTIYDLDIVYADTASKAKLQCEDYGDYKNDKNEYCTYVDIKCRRAKEDDVYIYEGRKMSYEDVLYEIKITKWREDMKSLVEKNKGKKVRIWSDQWNAYWSHNGGGYSTRVPDIGIYDIEDAWKRVSHVGLEKKISFELIK